MDIIHVYMICMCMHMVEKMSRALSIRSMGTCVIMFMYTYINIFMFAAYMYTVRCWD